MALLRPAAAGGRDLWALLLPALTAAGVAVGGILAVAGSDASAAWAATALLVLVPLSWSVVRALAH